MFISEFQTIKEILDKYPETFSVFSDFGFRAEDSRELIAKLGEALLLRTALKVIGINKELFISQLEDKILENSGMSRDNYKIGLKLYA